VSHGSEARGTEAKGRNSSKLTEKRFGISRESAMKANSAKQEKEKKGPIDEVKALKDIFYDFFNANSQA